MSAGTTITCLLLTLSFLSHGQGQPFVQLATGTGVLQAQQSTSTSGTLTESQDFCPSCQEQQWQFIQGSTGVFVQSIAYPNLVWDCQKGIVAARNPIILYQRKSSPSETTNQRWVLTSTNQFSLVANTSFVAQPVHSSSSVVLVLKNSSNAQIIQIPPTEVSSVTVVNWLPYTVFVSFVTIVGNREGEQLWQSYQYSTPVGSWIGIYNHSGALVYNTTVNSTVFDISIPRTDLPSGTNQWVGWSRPPPKNGTNDCTLSLTWLSDLNLNGGGTDNYGEFTIESGTYDLGGNVNFNRVYATFSYHSCYGGLGNTSNTLTGGCYDSAWVEYNFQYTMVK